jgi:hypothetical protein
MVRPGHDSNYPFRTLTERYLTDHIPHYSLTPSSGLIVVIDLARR